MSSITEPQLSDSTTTHIEANTTPVPAPAAATTTTTTRKNAYMELDGFRISSNKNKKRKEGKGKGGCRDHRKKLKVVHPPELTFFNLNTIPLYENQKDGKRVYFGLFTAKANDRHVNIGGPHEYYDCTFIHEVADGKETIFKQGEQVKLISFNLKTSILKAYKDGKVYSCHTAYTFFGMKVEEDSESTSSSDEDTP